jgi:hypothetical protein
MRYLLSAIAILACANASAMTCPDLYRAPKDYLTEIMPLRAQQDALTKKINNAADTETAIGYVRESDRLDERICDAIGQAPILK